MASLVLGGNVLLFGADGCGRTAVLHEVARQFETGGQTVTLVDGSGLHDPDHLLAVILRASGLPAPETCGVPLMLSGIRPDDPAGRRVIAIDDLEVSAGQELFGRWRRHLWRLGARWVAVGGGEDPTPYLDGGAAEWWEDGVLPVPPLDATNARILVDRSLREAGFTGDGPDPLITGARGNPRELLRRARSFLVSEIAVGASDQEQPQLSAAWVGGSEGPLADELSADEARMVGILRSNGSFSLADPSVLQECGWAYGKTHRIANELVRRGWLRRAEVPGEIGRPRVVYSLAESASNQGALLGTRRHFPPG